MMTIAELRAELDGRVDQATRNAADSRKIEVNSFVAGYDAGWRDALILVVNLLNGEDV